MTAAMATRLEMVEFLLQKNPDVKLTSTVREERGRGRERQIRKRYNGREQTYKERHIERQREGRTTEQRQYNNNKKKKQRCRVAKNTLRETEIQRDTQRHRDTEIHTHRSQDGTTLLHLLARLTGSNDWLRVFDAVIKLGAKIDVNIDINMANNDVIDVFVYVLGWR